MPRYSDRSKSRLYSCHQDLRLIFETVIVLFDNTILRGHRSKEDQDHAYDSGNSQVKWPNSMHNSYPSMAVDAVPYPIDWHDRERMTLFAGYVIGIAEQLYIQGKISHKVRWGGDWDKDTFVDDNDFDDLVHFELIQ